MTRACWNCGKLVSDVKFCSNNCERNYKEKMRSNRREAIVNQRSETKKMQSNLK